VGVGVGRGVGVRVGVGVGVGLTTKAWPEVAPLNWTSTPEVLSYTDADAKLLPRFESPGTTPVTLPEHEVVGTLVDPTCSGPLGEGQKR